MSATTTANPAVNPPVADRQLISEALTYLLEPGQRSELRTIGPASSFIFPATKAEIERIAGIAATSTARGCLLYTSPSPRD